MFSLQKVQKDEIRELMEMVADTDTKWYVPSTLDIYLWTKIDNGEARFLLSGWDKVWCLITWY